MGGLSVRGCCFLRRDRRIGGCGQECGITACARHGGGDYVQKVVIL